MKIGIFLTEMSSFITDLERKPTEKKVILLMKKIINRFVDSFSEPERKRFRKIIVEFKRRLNSIQPSDNRFKKRIVDLQEQVDMFKAVYENND